MFSLENKEVPGSRPAPGMVLQVRPCGAARGSDVSDLKIFCWSINRLGDPYWCTPSTQQRTTCAVLTWSSRRPAAYAATLRISQFHLPPNMKAPQPRRRRRRPPSFDPPGPDRSGLVTDSDRSAAFSRRGPGSLAGSDGDETEGGAAVRQRRPRRPCPPEGIPPAAARPYPLAPPNPRPRSLRASSTRERHEHLTRRPGAVQGKTSVELAAR